MGGQSGKSQNILQEEQAQGQEKEMGTLELVGSLVQSHFQERGCRGGCDHREGGKRVCFCCGLPVRSGGLGKSNQWRKRRGWRAHCCLGRALSFF